MRVGFLSYNHLISIINFSIRFLKTIFKPLIFTFIFLYQVSWGRTTNFMDISKGYELDFKIDNELKLFLEINKNVNHQAQFSPLSGIINIPTSHDFGARRLNSTFFWWLKIENLGTDPLSISSWSTSSPDFYLEENVFPMIISPNSFKYVRVWFKPSSIGMIHDTLRIFNNSFNQPEAKIFLSGYGEFQQITLGMPLWTFTVPDHPVSNTFRTVKGIRAFNDITGDGKSEVVVCTENYWVVALNGNSSNGNDTLWSFNTYISNYSAGSIGTTGDYSYQKALSIASDLNGDGFNDIVIGTGGGNESVYALNGKNGNLLWRYGTDHPDSFALGDFTGVDASTDFNNDGFPDVIAAAAASQVGGTAGRRTVYLFNGTNGQILWQCFVGGFTHGVTAIRDVTGDNIPDVVATVGEPNYSFVGINGASGQIIWNFPLSSGTGGGKEVLEFPITGQNSDVIASAFWGPIYRLRGSNGGVVWSLSTGNKAPTQLKLLPDITGDGVPEIVASILAGGALCINGANGNVIWSLALGNTMGVDVIPDLNGDGSYDVVFAVQSQGALIVNGADGSQLALYSFGGSIQAREVAFIPDIDNSNSYDILVGSNLGNVACVSGGVVAPLATINVISPNGNEIWYLNQPRKIMWVSNNVENVKIEISSNNGGSWNIITQSFPANTGYFDWIVTGTPSNQYRLKISSVENPNVFDLSDDIFEIRSEYCSQFSVDSFWNLISVPVRKSSMAKNDLFPSSISNAYSFSEQQGYFAVDSLENGKGYWLKFPANQLLNICGMPLVEKQIAINGGWNIIGGFETDVPVSLLITDPPNIIRSYFFGYNNGYFISNILQPGKAYWVKTSQNGIIYFPESFHSGKLMGDLFTNQLEQAQKLIITDAKGNSANLYLTNDTKNYYSELPPEPPKGIFDVRFSDNRFIAQLDTKNEIVINSAYFPIIVRCANGNVKFKLKILENDEKILTKENEVVITNSKVNRIIIEPVNVPMGMYLYQNYPNPFNPSTIIRYDLNEDAKVQLKIYDLVGRELAILVDKEQPAGSYKIELNSNSFNLSSGIYFYHLKANDYVSTRKLMIIK